MSIIYNEEIMKKILRETRLQQLRDKIPNELADKILPTLNVNPDKSIKITNALSSDATSANIKILSTTKDTYIVGVELAVSKDAVSDSLQVAIRGEVFGLSPFNLTTMRLEPTTAAQNLNSYRVFPFPIKMKKGSTISLTSSTATASIDLMATLFYYEVDTTD